MSKQTVTYPTESQQERWRERAEEMDMTLSEFIAAMVEAGMKKFDATVKPDETTEELRQQRNELKEELDHARERIERLEEELYTTEREAIIEYVEKNPGAGYKEIVQHVIDTAGVRTREQLDKLEGEVLRIEDGGYYPTNGGE